MLRVSQLMHNTLSSIKFEEIAYAIVILILPMCDNSSGVQKTEPYAAQKQMIT
jgi:hypothetical protein